MFLWTWFLWEKNVCQSSAYDSINLLKYNETGNQIINPPIKNINYERLKNYQKHSVLSGLWRKSSFPLCFLSVSHISRSKFHIMIGVNVQYFWCATNPFTDRPFLNTLPFYIRSASPPVPNSVPRSLEVKRKKINAESWLIRKNAFNLRTETLNAENVTVSCRCRLWRRGRLCASSRGRRRTTWWPRRRCEARRRWRRKKRDRLEPLTPPMANPDPNELPRTAGSSMRRTWRGGEGNVKAF